MNNYNNSLKLTKKGYIYFIPILFSLIIFFVTDHFLGKYEERNIISIKSININVIDNEGILQKKNLITKDNLVESIIKSIKNSKECNLKILSRENILLNSYYLNIDTRNIEKTIITFKSDSKCKAEVINLVKNTLNNIITEKNKEYKYAISVEKNSSSLAIINLRYITKQVDIIREDIDKYVEVKKEISLNQINSYVISLIVLIITYILVFWFRFNKISLNRT